MGGDEHGVTIEGTLQILEDVLEVPTLKERGQPWNGLTEIPTLAEFMTKLEARTETLRLIVHEEEWAPRKPGLVLENGTPAPPSSPKVTRIRELEIWPADLLRLITDVLGEPAAIDEDGREW